MKGIFTNCPIMKRDILSSDDMFRPKSWIIESQNYTKDAIETLDNLPEGMLEEHGNVKLAVDIMCINKIPFIVTTSRAREKQL